MKGCKKGKSEEKPTVVATGRVVVVSAGPGVVVVFGGVLVEVLVAGTPVVLFVGPKRLPVLPTEAQNEVTYGRFLPAGVVVVPIGIVSNSPGISGIPEVHPVSNHCDQVAIVPLVYFLVWVINIVQFLKAVAVSDRISNSFHPPILR